MQATPSSTPADACPLQRRLSPPAAETLQHRRDAHHLTADQLVSAAALALVPLAVWRADPSILNSTALAILAVKWLLLATGLAWLRIAPASYLRRRSYIIAVQRLYPHASRGINLLFLALARGGQGVVNGHGLLQAAAAVLVVLYFSQAPRSVLIAQSMELPLPLHAALQIAGVAMLLAGSYNRDVCVTPPLTSPMTARAIDCMFAGLDILTTMLLPILPPPGAVRPSTPGSRCQAVLAFLQLAIGLTLPVLLTAVRDAHEYDAWCMAARHDPEEHGNASANWQAAVNGAIQRWCSWARARPLAASTAACMLAGLIWQAVVLVLVPPGTE